MAGRTGLGYSPSGGSAPSVNRLPSFNAKGGTTAEGGQIGPTGKLPPVGGGTTLTGRPLSKGGTQAPPFDPGNQPGRPSVPPQYMPDLLKALGGGATTEALMSKLGRGATTEALMSKLGRGATAEGNPVGMQAGAGDPLTKALMSRLPGFNPNGRAPGGSPMGTPGGWGAGNDGVSEQVANQLGKKMFGGGQGGNGGLGISLGGGATAEGNPVGSPGGWGSNGGGENDANQYGKKMFGITPGGGLSGGTTAEGNPIGPPDPASSMTNLRAIASSMGLHGGPLGGMVPQNQTNTGAGPLDTGSPGYSPSNPMISSLAGSAPSTLQAITSVLNGGAPGGPQAAIMGVNPMANPMTHPNPAAPPPGANVPGNKNLGFAASGGGGGMAPANRLAY